MNPKASKDIKSILEKIVRGYSLGKEYNDFLEYSIKGLIRDLPLHESELFLILSKLEEQKIIDFFVDTGNDNVIAEETYTIYFPDDFITKASLYLNNLSDGEEANSPSKALGMILYLDADGNLWHGDKKSFCYSIGAQSKRFFLIKYLVDNEGYQNSEDIFLKLGYRNPQSLRTEISKIRLNIYKFLRIEEEELIQSKRDSGYRINPKYKVIWDK